MEDSPFYYYFTTHDIQCTDGKITCACIGGLLVTGASSPGTVNKVHYYVCM